MNKRLLILGCSRSGTTITRDIVGRTLGKTSKIFNEARIYDAAFIVKNVEAYVVKVCRQLHLDKKFLDKFLTDLHGVTDRKLWIKYMESQLFQEEYVFFGDKTQLWPFRYEGSCAHLKELGFQFDAIYIYRDGRDVVASNIKSFAKVKNYQNPRAVRLAGDRWVGSIRRWQRFINSNPNDRTLTLRFEDYIYDTNMQSQKIASFLNINKKRCDNVIMQLFTHPQERMGKHKFLGLACEHLSQEANELLKELGYI